MISRVAYILSFTHPNSGSTKAFIAMLNGLMKKGVTPVVVLPDREGIFDSLIQQGIEVHVLSFRMNTYPNLHTFKDYLLFLPRTIGRLCLNYFATQRLKRILVATQVQLVHSNVSVLDIGFRAAHQLGLPHVVHFREYTGKLGFHYLPAKSCFYNAIRGPLDYNICITKGVQQYHRQSDNPRSVVIYDGVSHAITAIPPAAKKRYFLFAGRIEPVKGLMDLLQAYAKARLRLSESRAIPASAQQSGSGLDQRSRAMTEPPVLKIAGLAQEALYVRAVMNFVEEHDLSASVQFLGDRDDIAELMQHAHAIVVPSRSEGFGLCVAEAMFNGCIVVGADNTGIREQFNNGERETGKPIAYRYTTIDDLTNILVQLSQADPQELEPMRHRAFNVVNKLYSVENNVSKVYEFYQTISK